jgi:hypothetical protein
MTVFAIGSLASPLTELKIIDLLGCCFICCLMWLAAAIVCSIGTAIVRQLAIL